MLTSRLSITTLFAGALFANACGYTTEEYQLQGDKLTRSLAKQRTAETRADEATTELDSAKARVAALESKLRALGVDLDQKDARAGDISTTLADRERALAEFRARAAKLDETRTRLQLLKAKLSTLGNSGVQVRIRKNRLVISLPADAVFEANSDKLRKDGRAALLTIAEVIKNEPVLATRDFQVAGHTDSKGQADNMGRSLARAKAVLSLLLLEGGLTKEHWSAAGYGDTDPLAESDSEDGQKQNRRCELVMAPSPAEILDLRQLAVEQSASASPKKPVLNGKLPPNEPAPKQVPNDKEPKKAAPVAP